MSEKEAVKRKKSKSGTAAKLWERDRRRKWKESVQTLAKLLPNYDPAVSMSQLHTLNEAIIFIKELKNQNNALQNGEKDGIFKEKIEKLKKRVKELIQRIDQLTDLLRSANIKLPPLVTYPSSHVPDKPLSAKPRWIERVPHKFTVNVSSNKMLVVSKQLAHCKVNKRGKKTRSKFVEKQTQVTKPSETEKKETNVNESEKKFTDLNSPSQTKENRPIDFNLQLNESVNNNTSVNIDKLCSLTSSISANVPVVSVSKPESSPNKKLKPIAVSKQSVQTNNIVLPTTNIIQPNTYILTNDGSLLPCYPSPVINQPTQNVLTPVIINRTPPLLVLQKPPVIQAAQIVNTNQVFNIQKPVQLLNSNETIPVKSNLPLIMAKPPPAKKRILRDSTVTTFVNKVPITALSKQSYSSKKLNTIVKGSKISKNSEKVDSSKETGDKCGKVTSGVKRKSEPVSSEEKKKKVAEENTFEPIKDPHSSEVLKLPPSEKEPCSVSPTAAFLSIFPIVAANKNDEEAEEAEVRDVKKVTDKDSKGTQTSKPASVPSQVSPLNKVEKVSEKSPSVDEQTKDSEKVPYSTAASTTSEETIKADVVVKQIGVETGRKDKCTSRNNVSLFLSKLESWNSSQTKNKNQKEGWSEKQVSKDVNNQDEEWERSGEQDGVTNKPSWTDKTGSTREEVHSDKETWKNARECAAWSSVRTTQVNTSAGTNDTWASSQIQVMEQTLQKTAWSSTQASGHNKPTDVDGQKNVWSGVMDKKETWLGSQQKIDKNLGKEGWVDKDVDNKINEIDNSPLKNSWKDNHTIDKQIISNELVTHKEVWKSSVKPVESADHTVVNNNNNSQEILNTNWSEGKNNEKVCVKNTNQNITWQPMETTYTPVGDNMYSNNFCMTQHVDFQKSANNCSEHFSYKNNFNQLDNSQKVVKTSTEYNQKCFPPTFDTNKTNQTKLQNKNFTPASTEPRNTRPPVNWMTGPDIRSSAMQNNPSFGVQNTIGFTTDTYANSGVVNKNYSTNRNSSSLGQNKNVQYGPKNDYFKSKPDDNFNVFDYNCPTNSNTTSYYDLDKSQYCQNQLYVKNKSRHKKKSEQDYAEDSKKKSQTLLADQFNPMPNPNQDCWTPMKNVDWLPNNNFVVPQTLPTLVGDLALGTTPQTSDITKTIDKQIETSKLDMNIDQTNLSRNIFDVTNPKNDIFNSAPKTFSSNNNSETIVLKNIFELPASTKTDSFVKDKIQYSSQNNRNSKNRIQTHTNSFLSVSQLVEAPNTFEIMKNDELRCEEQLNNYNNFSNSNVSKQYKGKSRVNYNGKNDRKYNFKNNYSAEALMRSSNTVSYQSDITTDHVSNINYYDKPKSDMYSDKETKTDLSQAQIHSHNTSQNVYTDFNYSSPVPNFNLAANISCSLNNDFLTQHDSTFTHQNNIFSDFIPEYPVSDNVLLPCSNLQNPFLSDKKIDCKKRHTSKKKYECVKNETTAVPSSFATCPPIFTNNPTSQTQSNSKKMFHSTAPIPFSTSTLPTNSYQKNSLPTVPFSQTSTPFSCNNITFPVTTSSNISFSVSNTLHSPFPTPSQTVPFLSLPNPTVPPSAATTIPSHSSSNSLANFNLSTIFPEINQKVNFHYS